MRPFVPRTNKNEITTTILLGFLAASARHMTSATVGLKERRSVLASSSFLSSSFLLTSMKNSARFPSLHYSLPPSLTPSFPLPLPSLSPSLTEGRRRVPCARQALNLCAALYQQHARSSLHPRLCEPPFYALEILPHSARPKYWGHKPQNPARPNLSPRHVTSDRPTRHQKMPAPTVRVCGVCGALDPAEDDWMVANMRMYHSTTSHVQDAKWFTAIDMAAYNAQTNLHGHPNAERLIIDDCGTGRESWDWATRVPPMELKARFVISVRNAARAAREGDRLVVFIVGHGSQASRTKGHGFVGEHSVFNSTTLLRPEDVLITASRSRGNTTVIVDACYSGTWGSALDLLGAGRSSRGTIALLTRSIADNETLSFPWSNSRRYQGSYFAHFLADGLYLEFCLFCLF